MEKPQASISHIPIQFALSLVLVTAAGRFLSLVVLLVINTAQSILGQQTVNINGIEIINVTLHRPERCLKKRSLPVIFRISKRFIQGVAKK